MEFINNLNIVDNVKSVLSNQRFLLIVSISAIFIGITIYILLLHQTATRTYFCRK